MAECPSVLVEESIEIFDSRPCFFHVGRLAVCQYLLIRHHGVDGNRSDIESGSPVLDSDAFVDARLGLSGVVVDLVGKG